MKKIKALFFTPGEGQKLILIPDNLNLTKDEFENGGWVTERHTSYSPELGIDMTLECFVIQGIRMRSIFFDNGFIYECTMGYRHLTNGLYSAPETKIWLNEQYKIQKS